MAVNYLTNDWAAELTTALNADAEMLELAAGQDALLQMVVTDSPYGEVPFYYLFDDGEVTVSLGVMGSSDVTGTISYDDAVALAKGELGGQQAVLTKKMKTEGNLGKIIQLAPVLERLTKVQNTLRVNY